MNNFDPFDPLKAKSTADTEVAALAQKREIKNILSSYVGWFDPFSELIQNSLDAVEERAKSEGLPYVPHLWITIDIKNNSLTVTDNGIGLDQPKFTQFLCPDISFKSGITRGHKGVGATYLAYGFNYIQVATRTPDFVSVGKMENARSWLTDENPSGNPQVKPDTEAAKDEVFTAIDRGVSIHVKFDSDTHPKNLRWIVADSAEKWFKILSVKTGLGAFTPNTQIQVTVKVVDKDGKTTTVKREGIGYLWIQSMVAKSASIAEIKSKEDELYAKKGREYTMPAKLSNLDAFYQKWTTADLKSSSEQLKFSEDHLEILDKYEPEVYVSYVYSTKIWDAINQSLGIRSGVRILYGGIQLAANNMPQGETIQIPLNRNIGRQNQIHMVFHFNNYTPDLGRKGFQSEVVEFAKETAQQIADKSLMKYKARLRANTGTAPNLIREKALDEWKQEMSVYEKDHPLNLISEKFFLPLRKISITSIPTREQDVIALFNQLLAGGVIRGIRIMSTNERFTYDGLFRIVIEEPKDNQIYHKDDNPLGLDETVVDDLELPFGSMPKVLEYKYSLDGLIEDIENGNKNSNDVSLIVVWESGELYKSNYKITSLLDQHNLTLREYHGLTHTITNVNTGQKEMDLIILSELVEYLNSPEGTVKKQVEKYEE